MPKYQPVQTFQLPLSAFQPQVAQEEVLEHHEVHLAPLHLRVNAATHAPLTSVMLNPVIVSLLTIENKGHIVLTALKHDGTMSDAI